MATVLEKVRAALAEAGYPNARIEGTEDDPEVWCDNSGAEPSGRLVWQVFRLIHWNEAPCYQCWQDGTPDPCEAGECPNAGREEPQR